MASSVAASQPPVTERRRSTLWENARDSAFDAITVVGVLAALDHYKEKQSEKQSTLDIFRKPRAFNPVMFGKKTGIVLATALLIAMALPSRNREATVPPNAECDQEPDFSEPT